MSRRNPEDREIEGDIRDYDDAAFLPGGKNYDPDLDTEW